ncbi:EF hand [Prosthecobacter debontii]|uniref:EF hand n=1 Tax=Prosthecobacter debontii TaxID=48467 RepID=A0A1T4XFC5_9BACT|nr:EF-hand domain-containing protein [Prosthecobacter debontii]SKA88250.1 EF hand [Prosthecobacter debontii]
MKSSKTPFCFLGLLSLSASLAFAQEGAPKGPPPEGEGRGGGRLAEFLKRADANGDGKISKEEFGAMSQREGNDERFARMDTNSDGYVDQAEMASVAEKMREGMRGGRPGEGGGFRRPDGEGKEGGFRRPPGGSPEGGARPDGERPQPPEGGRRPEGGPPGGPGGPPMDEIFGRMDKDADGSVSKEEYVEFSKQEIETRFSRVDENADGKLTKDEMRAGMERIRNMMRGPGGQGGPGFGRGPGDGDRRPGGEGGPRRGPDGGGEGGFRRPPSQDGDKAPGKERPEFEGESPKKEADAPKKDAA